MKSTTYIVEITNQKSEKYLYVWLPPHLPRLMSAKKFSAFVYGKVFCRFWPVKLHDLPHVVSAAPIFLGIFFYHSYYGMTLKF